MMLMVPQQDLPPMNAAMARKRPISLFVAIIMTMLFIVASVVAVTALIGQSEAESDLDLKIAAANVVAVEEAEAAKEVEFTERLKDPFASYTGPSTFGSLTFGYPKSWSALVDTSSNSTPVDFFAHPDIIPGLDDTNFALRVQIVDSPYDEELSSFERAAESGDVTINPFRPEQVSEVLGVVIRGEIDRGKSGILVLLPQRDKTFKFSTESTDFEADFTNIVQTITYNP